MNTGRVNNVSESNVLRYLQQIFKVKVSDCESVEEALREISSVVDCVPEGLTEAILLPQRFNVRNELWNLTIKSSLVKSILELVDTNYTSLLLCDSTLQGKDSLILCLAFVCKEQEKDDAIWSLSDSICNWSKKSKIIPKMQISSIAHKSEDDTEIIVVCALQLSSYVPDN